MVGARAVVAHQELFGGFVSLAHQGTDKIRNATSTPYFVLLVLRTQYTAVGYVARL